MLRYVDTFHTSREVAGLKVRKISRFNQGQLQIWTERVFFTAKLQLKRFLCNLRKTDFVLHLIQSKFRQCGSVPSISVAVLDLAENEALSSFHFTALSEYTH